MPITFNFDVRLFPLLVIGFILFTVIGTLTHELGHHFAGKFSGVDSRINYKSTYYDNTRNDSISRVLHTRCTEEKKIGYGASCKALENFLSKARRDYIVITSAGPLQTTLTGSLGLLILFIRRSTFRFVEKLHTWQWLVIFVTLFWLRQIFNALVVTWNAHTNDELGNGDEMRLSVLFRMHPLALNIISALLGTIVFCIVLFKFIPLRNRFTFLIAGISGGIIGYYLWFDQLGPVVLP